MALKHRFVSGVADGPDATKLRPSNWGSVNTDYSTAPTHVFDGGALGSLLMRDTGSVDGSSWLAAGAAGLVLTANGVGLAPTWQAGGGGGGLFGALTDPNVDRIPFWDDSAGAAAWLAPGNSVAITGTTFDTIQDIRTTATPTFGQVLLGDGSVSAPSLTNTGDDNTGIYFAADGEISFTSNGVKIGYFGTPSGASNTSNFLNVTGTFPATLTAAARGLYLQFTGAGSSSQPIRAIETQLLAGYTGASGTTVSRNTNSSAGTNTAGWALGGNVGVYAETTGVTSGSNLGLVGTASQSSSLNIGFLGRTASSGNTPALNVGIAGMALSATVNVAGFFGLTNVAPTLGTSAALIADNGSQASDIFLARDNGTVVFAIQDGGGVKFGTHTGIGAETVTGYITITDAGGTARKLAVVS